MKATHPNTVEDGVVVTLEYTVKVAGETVDTSEGHEPIQFIQGQGMVIDGLGRALYGLSAGERKQFVVLPGDGYGETDPDAIAQVPLSEFPPEIPLQPGVELTMKDEEGDEMQATIVEVGDVNVTLDFNHPLAGVDLDFSVEVIALRWATEEELDHGHVH